MGSAVSLNETHNESKPYVVADEIIRITEKINSQLESFEKAKESYEKAVGKRTVVAGEEIHFEDQDFEIVLEGNGKKTKEILEPVFPSCTFEVGQMSIGSSYSGSGRNEYTDTYVKDSLRVKIKT